MKVIEYRGAGGTEVLALAERPLPVPGPGEVLVCVAAAGLNRPDVQQRRGLYPPPPGASDIPGLDLSGIVESAAPDVAWPRIGDAVCAIVTGAAHAEYCAVPAAQCLPVPRGLSFVEAASLPEVFFTAWNNIIWLGRLGDGETLLVQGGTSGVGLAAIQIAKRLRGARVIATAGTPEKRRVCLETGADAAIDYRDPHWPALVRDASPEAGVDVILDAQAGDYTRPQMELLAPDGRLVLIASHRGTEAVVDLRAVVRRRLTLTGSTLRPRPPAYKGRLGRELREQVWPLLENGQITTRIFAALPLERAAEAHALLDANEQIGKVVLVLDTALANSRPSGRFAAG
ncbi:NAD(P)H-quinone oxidoreductase [Roseomonas sp. KE2513]|uniref:NAD(P)H-quinone oxidoreductase n=1 Tax=Roseomonas sp. KE2513 TaxID=2479202 RepID=UPI00281583EC|nr:NAD(P)H-quinone oxidoreductase [Roseomonas sp. KE2513]MBI0537972.1 NAD(P)H-quinone oxidoreductase [Roseomonas sp. KE2513]